MPNKIVNSALLWGLSLTMLLPMMAQESTGNISGTVSEPAGAVVPDATVAVSNSATGLNRVTKTNASGLFFVSNLPVGNYNLLN